MNCPYQVCRCLRLHDVSLDGGSKGLQHVLLLGMHGKQDDSCSGRDPTYLVGGAYPIEERHGEIEDRHVRLKVVGPPDSLQTVESLPNDLEVVETGRPSSVFAPEESLQPLTKDFVVVGQDKSERHVNSPQ